MKPSREMHTEFNNVWENRKTVIVPFSVPLSKAITI